MGAMDNPNVDIHLERLDPGEYTTGLATAMNALVEVIRADYPRARDAQITLTRVAGSVGYYVDFLAKPKPTLRAVPPHG